jgi:hypothetical protein
MKLSIFRAVPLSIVRSSCSKAVFKTVWHIPLVSVQWINSWRWTEELSERCRVSWQNKFVKLVHPVGFITKKFVTMHGYMKLKFHTYSVYHSSDPHYNSTHYDNFMFYKYVSDMRRTSVSRYAVVASRRKHHILLCIHSAVCLYKQIAFAKASRPHRAI